MRSQALVGSALVALGVSTGSLLAPQTASALDFNFSFGGVGPNPSPNAPPGVGVEGLISGLVDNTANQVCSSDTLQPPWTPAPGSCVVSVTNTGRSSAPTGVYSYYIPRQDWSGFSLQNGQITSAQWNGGPINTPSGSIQPFVLRFNLNNGGRGALLLDGSSSPFCRTGEGCLGVVSFVRSAPSSSTVPGPLPLFGAAAAFGFSRKLRNRIKVTRTTAPTRPAG